MLKSLLAAILLPAVAAAQSVSVADLRRHVTIIADDSTMGRLSGSRGDDAAARYVAAEFGRSGLAPAGEGGTYFQTVPLVVRQFDWPATVLHVGPDTLAVGTDYVPSPPFGALPWGPLRPIRGAEAVYGGVLGDTVHGIDSTTATDRFVILALPRTAGWRAISVLGDGIPPHLRGAAAIAVVALDLMSGDVVASASVPRMHLDAGARDTAHAPTVLIISTAASRRLLGVALDSASPGMRGVRVDGGIAIVQGPPEVPARNVIAVLPGSDRTLRATYVSLSAHHDHIGFNHTPVDHDSLHAYLRAYERFRQASPTLSVTREQAASIRVNVDSLRRRRPPRPDSIYNGADDDVSGIAALLGIARRLATTSARPRRSILFLAHTGEEEGLLGSDWYSDHPTVSRDSIVAEMDMDMVGRGAAHDLDGGGPAYLELIGSRRQSTAFGDLIDAVNARRAHPFHINYAFDAHDHPEGDWCRADHYSYARYGIPVGAFSTSYHGDYHAVTDEPQYLDYPHLRAIADFVADLAVTVANLEHRPVLDHPKPADPHAPCAQ